ncbi:MAG: hypothetical protein JOY80_13140, partial [Candidatus Dormibacteraeota bacterium]|nr:hypothetical protein [Candidatus Dormibacteraeota bacterium]
YGWSTWRLRVAPRLEATRTPGPPIRFALAGGAGVVIIAVAAVLLARQVSPQAEAAFERANYPSAAADYVGSAFPGQRLYSNDRWADYLAYRFPTGRVVFLYDQDAAFGQPAVAAYTSIHLLQNGWESTIRSEGIEHAIVDTTSQEASALHELGWQVDCVDSASGGLVMSAPRDGEPPAAAAPLAAPPTGAAGC